MNREEIINAVQSQADEVKNKFEELKGRAQVQAKLGEAEAKEVLQPVIDDVEKEVNNTKQKLEELKSASQEALEELNHGAQLAVKALQTSFDKAAGQCGGQGPTNNNH